jgi:pyruvate/2-oxoglutarate dehydrogenase complex dihydrolipoamide dehydrogenase (E3) component
MQPDIYDFVIIGAGQAGVPLAEALAKRNQRVALVERKHLGGSCINYGCTPTKAAIASAHLAHQARRAAEYGLQIADVKVDFEAVIKRASDVAASFRHGLEKRLRSSDNPVWIQGQARLDGTTDHLFNIKIGDKLIQAQQIILDTGAHTAVPRIAGLSNIDFIHAGNWLEHLSLPDHIAIIGGGYIAMEMGQFYRRMGSRVTIIERSAEILGREDPDVSEAVRQYLNEEGVEFQLKTGVESIARTENGVELRLVTGRRATLLNASHLFIATGRKPNTDDLGLETVGFSAGNFLPVDEHCATPVEGIWAVGDVRGGAMFTHTAWDDYRVVLSQLTGDGSHTNHRVTPYAVFTDPELGRVGMTERQARQSGRQITIGKFDMKNDARSIEMGETRGFIKVIIDAATDQILGAAVLAAGGSELVHMYVDMMNARAPFTVIRDAVHIHPTQAESIQSAVRSIPSAASQAGHRASAA